MLILSLKGMAMHNFHSLYSLHTLQTCPIRLASQRVELKWLYILSEESEKYLIKQYPIWQRLDDAHACTINDTPRTGCMRFLIVYLFRTGQTASGLTTDYSITHGAYLPVLAAEATPSQQHTVASTGQ
jgi:hypothetical protein